MIVTAGTVPFTYWLIDGLVDKLLALDAYFCVPPSDWHGWVKYNNDCEKNKRCCNDLKALPRKWELLYDALGSEEVVRAVSSLAGIELTPDPLLHGAGCHVIDPGGYLGCHLDYSRHPLLPAKERRANLVLFLNPEWKEEWGGAFQMWDDTASKVMAEIHPTCGSCLIWNPGEVEYHSTGLVKGPQRVTAAAYYLAPARKSAVRKRALFIPKRS